jgi:dihydropteroate synthase
MMGAPGSDGSKRRVAERHDAPEIPHPRRACRVRFADGGRLELGRRTAVMGVVNVTPDSFSDGGCHLDPARARDAAARMAEAGAELIDIGGESTRPGAAPVDEAEEIRRVVPVVEAVKRELDIRVSIDTTKPSVARRAFDAGADMLNDVSALGDPEMLPLIRERNAPVVLMHMRGTPATMQRDTRYDDVVGRVIDFLGERIERAAAAGVAGDKILVDPGVGFGKDLDGNLSILRRLAALGALGKPILIGASRKSFIGAVLDTPVDDRLEGSLAVAAFASAGGAHVIRAHDVAATVRVVRMIDAIRSS